MNYDNYTKKELIDFLEKSKEKDIFDILQEAIIYAAFVVLLYKLVSQFF
jgi:hypothetical protein